MAHISDIHRHFAAALLAVAIVAGAGATAALAQDMPPTGVTVVTMQPQSLTLTTTLPGRVQASASAEVRPQVNGIITERLFTEGTQVKEGDILYRIDPTTYEAALAQSQAAMSQSQAQLDAAQRDYDRMAALRDKGVSSQQTFDDAISARDSASAALKVAEAQLKSAQIELDRTDIRARLSGRIGLSEVSQGALVTASQTTALTTIRRLDPVYVDVTQSAAELLAWRRGDTARDLGDANLDVSLTLADNSVYDQTGTLTAAEPNVDEQTGVVVLRMTFANPEQILLPGMYVQVEMPTTTVDDVYLAPQEGVSRDRRGNPVAMVVNAQNVVEQRALTVLQDYGNDWVVSDGLNPGDKIIVEGLQKVQPGATVSPAERGADAATENADAAGAAAQQD
ncbi:efflux RND transporter periplasmic adaptor subunit [Puniceibacterium sp. HSS470]|jgi:membrane fusion protein (multidrug efflux system)|nr:efflux RND transporter periplasmic adaptor subunit [Puniceibacterium sp. HSS470]|tara:strand:+ start:71193 stop:72377 length:1185 start_codon:yes stop_codon:yes gene_type:complete